MTWPWASTKPGTRVWPARSTSCVPGPLSFITSLRLPTAMILPLATATASARMALSFMVRMAPPDQMLSAVCRAGAGAAMAVPAASSRVIAST